MDSARSYGAFITTYLSNAYLKKSSYADKPKFKTFYRNIPWNIQKKFQIKFTVHGYWLPNTTCYSITLPNNETVILECTTEDRIKHLRPGCFLVINPQVTTEQEQIVCIKVLDRLCIGIVTPMQWIVELACYYEDYNTSKCIKFIQIEHLQQLLHTDLRTLNFITNSLLNMF